MHLDEPETPHMQVLKLRIDASRYPFPREFVRRVPIPNAVTYNRYEGLSLEQIEKRYGKNAAQRVYEYAALGLGDLTKPKIEPEKITIRESVYMRFEVKDCESHAVEITPYFIMTQGGLKKLPKVWVSLSSWGNDFHNILADLVLRRYFGPDFRATTP